MRTAIAAALLLVAVTAACGGGDDRPTDGTTDPVSATDGDPAASDPVAVVPSTLRSLRIGDPIELPNDLVLYIASGCFACDGPPESIDRVYRDASGEVRAEAVLSFALSRSGPYIHGAVVALDGELVAAVCSRGYCGNVGEATVDAQTTIYRSWNGGITWEAEEVFDVPYYLLGLRNDRPVAMRVHVAGEIRPPRTEVLSLGTLIPPSGADEQRIPRILSDGEVLWWSPAGELLDGAGAVILELAPLAAVDARPRSAAIDGSGRHVAVRWNDGELSLLSIFARSDGTDPALHVVTFETNVLLGLWLDDQRLLVNSGEFSYEQLAISEGGYLGSFPSILDVELGELRPIVDPFTRDEYLAGRNRAFGVVRGPIARVSTDDGSCLRVRAEPSIEAEVVSCEADGALFTLDGELSSDGVWAPIRGPGRLKGWMATEFLEFRRD